MTTFLGLLGLLALQRLAELWVSARNWKQHQQNATRPKEAIFPWMVFLHTNVFVLLPVEFLFRDGNFQGPLSILALATFIGAQGLRLWTLRTIGRSWNVRVVGATDYPIVTHGPYRWIRHPNYAVVILELVSLPLIWHLYFSCAVLTIGNALILRHRITNEEAMLAQNPAWVEKMAHKPRFIPRR